MQTVKQINPITYLHNISKSQTWDDSRTELKRVYLAIKPRLTEAQQNDLLIEIYNNINYSCSDGICTFWRYMNK